MSTSGCGEPLFNITTSRLPAASQTQTSISLRNVRSTSQSQLMQWPPEMAKEAGIRWQLKHCFVLNCCDLVYCFSTPSADAQMSAESLLSPTKEPSWLAERGFGDTALSSINEHVLYQPCLLIRRGELDYSGRESLTVP